MKKFLPVISILIAAFFAYGTVLAKDITERTMVGVKESRLDEVFALLGAFVVVAMVAGALVSTSTFRIVFAQRMRELALLRAVGASRSRLAVRLVLEGARTGLLASVAGVALAWVAAQAVPAAGLKAPGFLAPEALGVVAGSFALTTLAVLAPAISATKVSPLEALRTSAVQDTKASIGKARWLLGLAFLAGAGFTIFHVVTQGLADGPRKQDLTEELLFFTVLSVTLAFLALVCLGPVLISPLLRLVPARGAIGRLAVSGVGGAPRRAASITTIVALGVALVIGTIVGTETLRSLAKAEFASAYPADLEIIGPPLPNVGLKDVLTYRRIEVTMHGPPDYVMRVSDLNLRGVRNIDDFRFEQGSVQNMGPGRILLPTTTAERMQVKAGDAIRVSTEGGRELTLQVAATVFGGVPLQSSAILDPSDLDKLGAPSTPDGALANGPISAAAGMEVESLAEKRAEKENWFFSLFAVAIGLMVLTMLISVVGVGSTTALSVLERTRESGLLRAIGLTKQGLRTMVTTESAVYGVVGSALGLGIGIPYAWLAVVSLGVEWPLKVPLLDVSLVVAGLLALTALAGLLPARRAAKVSPVVALRD